MSKNIERISKPFEASLTGVNNIVSMQPMRLEVKPMGLEVVRHIRGLGGFDKPFWAYTAQPVEVCGPEGVKLQGGKIVPWDNFTHKDILVVVRLYLFQGETRPIVDLKSLLRER